ncbi:unnamed protein product [Camellia sinensis]
MAPAHSQARPVHRSRRLSDPRAGDALIQLYRNFITDFETKINLLKLAHFAVIVSWQYPEKEASIGYLEGVIEKLLATREMHIEEPILYTKMQIATFQLEKGSQKECKKLLEDRKSTLDSMTDIDPSVYANYYWVSSQYHKTRQEFAEFYKSALLYLAYTLVESLSESFKLDLAFDLSLAALLGENIYNFGELLAYPIKMKKLEKTKKKKMAKKKDLMMNKDQQHFESSSSHSSQEQQHGQYFSSGCTSFAEDLVNEQGKMFEISIGHFKNAMDAKAQFYELKTLNNERIIDVHFLQGSDIIMEKIGDNLETWANNYYCTWSQRVAGGISLKIILLNCLGMLSLDSSICMLEPFCDS